MLAASLITVAALTGCSPTSSSVDLPQSVQSSTPSVSPTAPSPRTAHISLDGIALDDDAPTPYSDGTAVLSLLSAALGTMPSGTPAPGGYGVTTYNWGQVRASTFHDGSAAVWVAAESVAGVRFQGPEGAEVGWTREQALAAGAENIPYDADGDGKADQMSIGSREVAGTKSLEDPSRTGREYVILDMRGDTVAQILSNGNDFSDL
jgi:hypothetical protein